MRQTQQLTWKERKKRALAYVRPCILLLYSNRAANISFVVAKQDAFVLLPCFTYKRWECTESRVVFGLGYSAAECHSAVARSVARAYLESWSFILLRRDSFSACLLHRIWVLIQETITYRLVTVLDQVTEHFFLCTLDVHCDQRCFNGPEWEGLLFSSSKQYIECLNELTHG